MEQWSGFGTSGEQFHKRSELHRLTAGLESELILRCLFPCFYCCRSCSPRRHRCHRFAVLRARPCIVDDRDAIRVTDLLHFSIRKIRNAIRSNLCRIPECALRPHAVCELPRRGGSRVAPPCRSVTSSPSPRCAPSPDHGVPNRAFLPSDTAA